MTLIVDSKKELLMLLIGLEAISEVIDNDERTQDWNRYHYIMLCNRVAREFAEMAEEDEAGLAYALAEGWSGL